jgi:gliding motility-associated-like protein
MKRFMPNTIFSFLFLFLFLSVHSQTFWTETFSNGCNANCLASSYNGPNGLWTVTTTGANGADRNQWYVSCAENGNAPPLCGTGCGSDPSLHIGSNATVVGDQGAAYLAGGLGFWFPETNLRAESPAINCTGFSNITLSFNYIEWGQGTTDDATLWYYDGSTWTQIDPLAKTLCCGSQPCNGSLQGLWVAFSLQLPASANNNPNVKIGFNWTNNDDNVGTDPSIAVDDITLSVPQPPVSLFTMSSNTICEGQCVTFTDNSTGPPTSWSWSFPGGNPSSSTSQNPGSVCYSTAGTYTVTLTVTNSNGSSSSSQTITVNTIPTITTSGNATICIGNNTTLSASGGTGCSWAPPAGLNNPNICNPVANPTSTTTYTVTVTGSNSCTNTATLTVTVNNCPVPQANFTASPSSGCAPLCVNFNDLSTNSPTSWNWSFPGATPSSSTQQNPTNICYTTPGTYTVTLIVSNTNGSDTTQQTITVTAPPVASAGPDATIFSGQSTTLNGSGGGSYSWWPPNGLSCINCQNPVASPGSSICYTLVVTQGSCSDSDEVCIEVINEISIFVPTAFSPNGDGQNDFLYVYGKGIKVLKFIVYDRWGEKVFQTDQMETTDHSTGWDGNFRGLPMNTGIFTWYLSVEFLNGQAQTMKGDLTLVR